MTSLGELREALDKIDNEISELYENGWKSAEKSENIK